MQNEQGEIVHTNIEDDFNNNSHWKNVLDALDDNYDVVIDNVNYKTKYSKIVRDSRTGNPVIDADSKPVIKDVKKNVIKQFEANRREEFNNKKLNDLINSGIEQINGQWNIDPYIVKRDISQKELVFVEELDIQSKDDIETMREKLKIKSIIKYADMLNQGYEFND